jgi:hypothetical protein
MMRSTKRSRDSRSTGLRKVQTHLNPLPSADPGAGTLAPKKYRRTNSK